MVFVDPLVFPLIPLAIWGGGRNGGGTKFVGGGGMLISGGGGFKTPLGGGAACGGGGGGIPTPNPLGADGSFSSSEFKSVKSKSHKFNGRVIFFTSSSQWSSFSDFLTSTGFLISWSILEDLEISPRLLLLASPSFAFEISPVKSLSQITCCFSSTVGLEGRLFSFCVKSLTVWSRFNCNKSFLSSFSASVGKIH